MAQKELCPSVNARLSAHPLILLLCTLTRWSQGLIHTRFTSPTLDPTFRQALEHWQRFFAALPRAVDYHTSALCPHHPHLYFLILYLYRVPLLHCRAPLFTIPLPFGPIILTYAS
eukprot:1154028-Pelagomonas_calceolata.AAC.21